jgi:hypothetical protein
VASIGRADANRVSRRLRLGKQYLGTLEQIVLLALAGFDGDADGMSIVEGATFRCRGCT